MCISPKAKLSFRTQNNKRPRKQVMNSTSTILHSFGLHFKTLREFCALEALDGVLLRHLSYFLPYHGHIITTTAIAGRTSSSSFVKTNVNNVNIQCLSWGHTSCMLPPTSTQANSAFYPSGVGKWGKASAAKKKAGMVHSVSGWTWGVQVYLWNPLIMRAIHERLRGVFMMSRYTNPRLLYLTLSYLQVISNFHIQNIQKSL